MVRHENNKNESNNQESPIKATAKRIHQLSFGDPTMKQLDLKSLEALVKQHDRNVLKVISEITLPVDDRSSAPISRKRGNAPTTPIHSPNQPAKRIRNTASMENSSGLIPGSVADATNRDSDADMMVISDGKERERALAELEAAISHKLQNLSLPGDWRVKFCKVLRIKPTTELLKMIDDSTNLLVEIKKSQPSQSLPPSPTNLSVAQFMEMIVEITQMIPLADKKNAFKPDPPAEVLQELAQRANSAIQSVQQQRLMSTHYRKEDQLSNQKSIEALSKACEGYVKRQKWYKKTVNDLDLHHKVVYHQIGDLTKKYQGINQMFELKLKDLAQEKKMREKRKDDIVSQLNNALKKKGKELQRQMKANAAEIELLSILTLFHSSGGAFIRGQTPKDNVAIANLVQNYTKIREQLEEDDSKYRLLNDKLKFLKNLIDLLNKVISLRNFSLKQERISLREEAQKFAADSLEKRLEAYVPELCRAITFINEFHSHRTQSARESLEKFRTDLQAHLDMYAESAPLERKYLEGRIQEYEHLIVESTEERKHIGQVQMNLWLNLLKDAPAGVQIVVSREFTKLLQTLDGPLRQILDKFIKEFATTEPSTSARVASPQKAMLLTPPAPKLMPTAGPTTKPMPTPTKANSSAATPKKSDTRIQPSDFGLGKRLITYFKDTGYVVGTVIAVEGNNTYTLEYDDGNIHTKVQRHFLMTSEEFKEKQDQGIIKAHVPLTERHADDSSPSEDEGTNSCTIM